jgi:DNA-binding transcriptional regulator GbsR (MarR family)
MEEKKIIEKFGLYFDHIGLNKTYGRMFGLFMTLDKPLSMSDVIEALQISKSTASTELRRLSLMGYIEKVAIPGQRADFYQLVPNVWQVHFYQKMEMIHKLSSIVQQIPAKERKNFKQLNSMSHYCDFMSNKLRLLIQEFTQTQDPLFKV